MKWCLLKYILGLSALSWQVIIGNFAAVAASGEMRTMRFNAKSPDEAKLWQEKARIKLFELMMGGKKPEKTPLNPVIKKREFMPDRNCFLEEISLNSLPDRKVHAWLAIPEDVPESGLPAVLALHGHGGTGEQVVKGEGIYWYGKHFADNGYVVASLDIGQHELQHENWTLMGERTWDALTCLEYLCRRPEVDKERVGTAGLSLGGETVMYVAALDEHLKIAVSSGWLTTIDNMKNGHCPCWSFPGLEEHLDFSDIFACVAPRHLIAQIGLQEKAPGGFPVDIAREAFKEIQQAYKVFGSEDRCLLDVHNGGHVFEGKLPLERFNKTLKPERVIR